MNAETKATADKQFFDRAEAYCFTIIDGMTGRRPLVERHAHATLTVLRQGPMPLDGLREEVGAMLYGTTSHTTWLDGRRVDKAMRRLERIGAITRNDAGRWMLLERGRRILDEPDEWFEDGRLPISSREMDVLWKRRKEAATLLALGAGILLLCCALGHPGVGMIGAVAIAMGLHAVFIASAQNGSTWRELVPWRYEDVGVIEI